MRAFESELESLDRPLRSGSERKFADQLLKKGGGRKKERKKGDRKKGRKEGRKKDKGGQWQNNRILETTGSSIASDISDTFAVKNWNCSLICGFFNIEVNYLRFYNK